MTTTQRVNLSRLHAINWYGYADSIPVVGNLLLAGVTGSGKSILMDLLQFVLVGDRRLVKFNQSATGEASTRDLKSYVLGDVKEDEDGVTQFMRDTAITYAALEFTWPRDPREEAERVETWGLWVQYENAADSGWPPFQRQHQTRARAQLNIVAKLLGWSKKCLMRTASAQLSGSSKFFEHCQGTLETLLAEASDGVVRTLIDLHIMPNPTAVRFHGSVRLHLGGTTRNYEGLFGESAMSETDISAADDIGTGALRCVTIENATTFHELCRIGCPDLLVFTSYPGQATVDFLRRLPAALTISHFGDTDPWGFDVLLHLRQKTGRVIEPLHMRLHAWAETMPPETRARRELTPLDREKLTKLLKNPNLADVRDELQNMNATGSTGDFEQEGLWPLSPVFPYVSKFADSSSCPITSTF